MILITTPLTAAALVILYVQLAMAVIKLRTEHKISIGDGNNDELETAIRAHGNLCEWAPIGLLLVAILELNGAALWVTAPPAIAFVVGRVLHGKGLTKIVTEVPKQRILGMQLTIFSLIALAALNILWMVYRFFVS